jgi:hypothetical protein
MGWVFVKYLFTGLSCMMLECTRVTMTDPKDTKRVTLQFPNAQLERCRVSTVIVGAVIIVCDSKCKTKGDSLSLHLSDRRGCVCCLYKGAEGCTALYSVRNTKLAKITDWPTNPAVYFPVIQYATTASTITISTQS